MFSSETGIKLNLHRFKTTFFMSENRPMRTGNGELQPAREFHTPIKIPAPRGVRARGLHH